MSSVESDLSRSTDGVSTNRIAAEDLGLGRWKVGDLATVGIVPRVPIQRHSSDLVLDSCGQFLDRVVQNSCSLAWRVSAGGHERQRPAKLTCSL